MWSNLAFYGKVAWSRWYPRRPKEEEEGNEATITRAFYVTREEGKDITDWMRQNHKVHRKGLWGKGDVRDIPLTAAKEPYYLCLEYRQFRELYRVHYTVKDGRILFPPYESKKEPDRSKTPVAAFVLPLEAKEDGSGWINVTSEFLKEAGPHGNFYSDLDEFRSCFAFWCRDLRVQGFVRLRFVMPDGEKKELSLLQGGRP